MKEFLIYVATCGLLTDCLLQFYGKQPVGWKRCILTYCMGWVVLPFGIIVGIFYIITGRRS